jgi:hypothetical protein
MSDPHASASAPAEDEPKTPMWLPALGATLFVSAGLWWAVTPGDPLPGADQPVASASAPATAAPPPAPTAAPRPLPTLMPASAQPALPLPMGAGSGLTRRPPPPAGPGGAQPRTRPNP